MAPTIAFIALVIAISSVLWIPLMATRRYNRQITDAIEEITYLESIPTLDHNPN